MIRSEELSSLLLSPLEREFSLKLGRILIPVDITQPCPNNGSNTVDPSRDRSACIPISDPVPITNFCRSLKPSKKPKASFPASVLQHPQNLSPCREQRVLCQLLDSSALFSSPDQQPELALSTFRYLFPHIPLSSLLSHRITHTTTPPSTPTKPSISLLNQTPFLSSFYPTHGQKTQKTSCKSPIPH